jgi:chlorite dismutase
MQSGLSLECQKQLEGALGADAELKNERQVSYWVSGHSADFCVMLMDPDPAKVDGVHQRIMAPGLGPVH